MSGDSSDHRPTNSIGMPRPATARMPCDRAPIDRPQLGRTEEPTKPLLISGDQFGCHVFRPAGFAIGGPHGGAPRGPIADGLHGGGTPHFAMGAPHRGGGPHGSPLRLGTRSRHGRRAPRRAPLHGGRQRQIRGSVPLHGARVLEVRIHLPPAGSQVRTRRLRRTSIPPTRFAR